MSNGQSREIETEDAKKVNTAAQQLAGGQVEAAVAILLDVASRAPELYTREILAGDTRYIKFWDLQEFTHFVTDASNKIQHKIVWLPSAYPRAFYYLGFAHVKLNQPAVAIQYLERGYKLEEHPMLLIERGKALSQLKRYDLAMASYEAALAIPGFPAQTRAVAVRGKGFQLVELNQLDAAELAFNESMKLDPNNPVAMNELLYIAQLRKGGRIAPAQTVVAGNKPLLCTICGSKLKDGSVVSNVDGRVVWRCSECAAKLPAGPGTPGLPSASSAFKVQVSPEQKPARAWWQFWK